MISCNYYCSTRLWTWVCMLGLCVWSGTIFHRYHNWTFACHNTLEANTCTKGECWDTSSQLHLFSKERLSIFVVQSTLWGVDSLSFGQSAAWKVDLHMPHGRHWLHVGAVVAKAPQPAPPFCCFVTALMITAPSSSAAFRYTRPICSSAAQEWWPPTTLLYRYIFPFVVDVASQWKWLLLKIWTGIQLKLCRDIEYMCKMCTFDTSSLVPRNLLYLGSDQIRWEMPFLPLPSTTRRVFWWFFSQFTGVSEVL